MELNFDFANGLKDDRYFNAFLNIGQAIVDLEIGKKRFILQVKIKGFQPNQTKMQQVLVEVVNLNIQIKMPK
jgi:hypothetical protein